MSNPIYECANCGQLFTEPASLRPSHVVSPCCGDAYTTCPTCEQPVVLGRPAPSDAVCLDSRIDWYIVVHVIYDALSLSNTDEGVVYATHDPSRKSPEEQAWEQWLLSTVLETGWVAPQLRDPVGRALLRTIYCTEQPATTIHTINNLVNGIIAPWLHTCVSGNPTPMTTTTKEDQ